MVCRLPLLSAALVAAVPLAGCGATHSTRVEIQQVKVAVPVPCDESERPNMSTEQPLAGADVDMFVQAADAEHERRERYEIPLRATLDNCKRPLSTW